MIHALLGCNVINAVGGTTVNVLMSQLVLLDPPVLCFCALSVYVRNESLKKICVRNINFALARSRSLIINCDGP